MAVLVSSCTPSDSTPSTTTTQPPATTTTAAPPSTTTTTIDPALAEPLPFDPDVVQGQLENGLTYFIKYNDSPGGRAELRLAVNAGSLNEDEDQAATAHFLEHMMFNGTTRFPRNELTDVLESFGPRFGPDINAYTSFDETVYQLSLATDDELLDLGMDVLREWASEATLTEQDVIEERGVVLEEWRLRDEGLSGRVQDALEELLLPGTPYEGRLPIGNADAIRAMDRETLAAFYEKWYRPDHMAVIAVGDFDVEDMEARIQDAFGSMERPTEDVMDPVPGVPPNEVAATTLGDPEVALASIQVYWPTASGPQDTVGSAQADIVHVLAGTILGTRLNDDALRGNLPLLSAGTGEGEWARGFALSTLTVTSKLDDVDEAAQAIAVEIERIRQHGFSDQEYERAFKEISATSEQRFEQSETDQDSQFAAGLVAHFLEGAAFASAKQRRDLEIQILDRITKETVERHFVDFMDEVAPKIIVVGPDDSPLPSVEAIEKAIASPAATSLAPRDDLPELETLMNPPAPVPPLTLDVDETFGYATITWVNGATVYLWPTTIAENLITLRAVSFGGTSVVVPDDVTEAELIPEVVSRSGVGEADAATYQLFTADRVVSAFPWISETREGVIGTAATEDAEAMLQTVHLLMTSPRFDQVAFDSVLASSYAVDKTRADVPSYAIGDALDDAYYSGDPRYVDPPSRADLDGFVQSRAMDIYRQRFGNAGDFAFAIVGDFDPPTMVDLVSRYIGSLPGTATREDFVDNQPLPPREVQQITVRAGTDPQGEVRMYFTNEFDPDLKDRLTGDLLHLIVNARLRDRIREELSATYSPSAGVSLQRDPDPFVETNVKITGDPERLDEIAIAALDELDDLARNGPTPEQFATAVQQLRTEFELINNVELANFLTEAFLYPDEPVVNLLDRYDVLEQITAADVRRLAAVAYNPRQRIEIHLVPIGFS